MVSPLCFTRRILPNFENLIMYLILIIFVFFYYYYKKHNKKWLNQSIKIWSEILRYASFFTALIISNEGIGAISIIGPNLGLSSPLEWGLIGSGMILIFFWRSQLVSISLLLYLGYKSTRPDSMMGDDLLYLVVFCIAILTTNFQLVKPRSLKQLNLRLTHFYLFILGIFGIYCAINTMFHMEQFREFLQEQWPIFARFNAVELTALALLTTLSWLSSLFYKKDRLIVSISTFVTLFFICFSFPKSTLILAIFMGSLTGLIINPYLNIDYLKPSKNRLSRYFSRLRALR